MLVSLMLLAGFAAQPAPATPAAPTTRAAASTTIWTVPQGWVEVPGDRPMRTATFKAGEGDEAVEVAVSQLAGEGGGLPANVNRWRGQLGLPPLKESEIAGEVTKFSNPGFDGCTMRIKGGTRHMLAAMIREPGQGRVWFVKATATPALAEKHEPAFLAFAKSFKNPQ